MAGWLDTRLRRLPQSVRKTRALSSHVQLGQAHKGLACESTYAERGFLDGFSQPTSRENPEQRPNSEPFPGPRTERDLNVDEGGAE